MIYRALKPIYVPTSEQGPGISRAGNRNNFVREDLFRVEWETLGLAADMAEAKKLYGGSPVLEIVRK